MSQTLQRAAGVTVVTLVALLMCAWSWGKWPDPVIDFGREIYVPWQIAEGKVLYRDIVSYFNGPLSPHVHALLFSVFAPSLRTLVIFNLLLIALLAAMLWWLIEQISDVLTATATGVAFFVLFAFAQFLPTGNYNYVTPYSYELTHGITLTAAGLVCLVLWVRRKHIVWLALAGGALGLIALTKAEILLAAAVALGGGIVGSILVDRARLRALPVFLAAAVAPPVLAFVLLLLVLDAGQAMRGMLGAWSFIGHGELTSLPYFRALAGTDDIPASLGRIFTWTGAYALVFAPAAAFGFLARSPRAATAASAALFLVLSVLGWMYWPQVNWSHFIAPAPLVLLATAIVLTILLIRRREPRLVLPLTMTLFAGAMLAKIPLNARIEHYGFALAMPATLMLIVILLGWLPKLLERRGASGWPLRAGVVAALLVAMWAYSHPMAFFYGMKTIPVAAGADRFYADARAVAINQTLRFLAENASPGETLVMLPEGLLVNYLARRTNPTGQLNFTPPAIIMYGEAAMLDAFQRNPPDWIGLVRIDTHEYGARFFGQHYARDLASWIGATYEPVPGVGRSTPREALEIIILRRRQSVHDGR